MSLSANHILVVEDEESMRLFLVRMLSRHGYRVTEAVDGLAAKKLIEEEQFDLVLTDLRMPKMEGLALLAWIQDIEGRLPVIVMTGYGSIPSAIEALKTGAENYITKPFEKSEILKAVHAALETGRLAAENKRLKGLLEDGRSFSKIVGSSGPMRQLFDQIDAVSNRRGTVLIHGESGTGKELVARAIHERSDRSKEPFVAVHLGAIPANLVAAELFGVTKGAFTGATADRIGSVQRAAKGILFLDEIGDAPLEVQMAILRLLEHGEMTKVGSSENINVDTRIVAATNRSLPSMVEARQFRQDLYYRLHVFALEVPPLRRRREDIPDLIRHFLALKGEDEITVPLALLARLRSYNWPGNVRELENVVERLLTLSGGGEMSLQDLPGEFAEAQAREQEDQSLPLKHAVAQFEKTHIEEALVRTSGNVSEAARQLEVSRPTLHGKIQQYRIDIDLYR